jgi:KDO2-lipid IV(A) lauroyltransferase
MVVTPPLYCEAGAGRREAEVREITVELTRRLEGLVRRFPRQYLWMHRRWRTPPRGGASF